MIADGDQAWVKNTSEYRNVKKLIHAYYEEIEETDFVPNTPEEELLYDLFFGWLKEKISSSISSERSPSLARAKLDRTIRIISDGCDDEDGDN